MDIESEQNGIRRTQAGARNILELGSNTGLFLSFCKEHGYSDVLGIDPAVNLVEMAKQNGIDTIPEFFNRNSANTAMNKIGNPSIILARHCFAHMQNWVEFIEALEILATSKTLVCIEVPWVHDMLKRAEFDTVYFEHLSYVNISSVAELLKSSPFRIHRIQHYLVHGGALLIMLSHVDSGIQPHLSADEFLSEDAVTISHWKNFTSNSNQKISRMRDAVREFTGNGKRVCGFGASAKSTVWIHACGFTKKDLLFVSDNSPLKPGRLVPGSDIPVIDQSEFLSEHPDVAICFAWNYRNEILETQKKWRARGGKFIFPTPDGIEIV